MQNPAPDSPKLKKRRKEKGGGRKRGKGKGSALPHHSRSIFPLPARSCCIYRIKKEKKEGGKKRKREGLLLKIDPESLNP